MSARKISTRWTRFVEWYVWSNSSIFVLIGLMILASSAVPLAHDLRASGRCSDVGEFLLVTAAAAVIGSYCFWLHRRKGRTIKLLLDRLSNKEPT